MVVRDQPVERLAPQLPIRDCPQEAGVQGQEVCVDLRDEVPGARAVQLLGKEPFALDPSRAGQRPRPEVGEAHPLHPAAALVVEKLLLHVAGVQREPSSDGAALGHAGDPERVQDQQVGSRRVRHTRTLAPRAHSSG
jgi:hypothetical protein